MNDNQRFATVGIGDKAHKECVTSTGEQLEIMMKDDDVTIDLNEVRKIYSF